MPLSMFGRAFSTSGFETRPKMLGAVLLVACIAPGCSEEKAPVAPLPAPKVAATPLEASAASQPAAATWAPAISKYREGDKVVYKYTGTFSAAPVTLTEVIKTITAGNVLEIEVTATRGTEVRRWLQVVTDTPENQKASLVDALFELDETGVKKKLENIQTDLFRMYEWTLPQPMDAPPEKSERTKEAVDILGTEYMCDVERGENTLGGKKVTFAFRQCPGFLWTKGPSELLTEDGSPVWKVEVVSSTRAP